MLKYIQNKTASINMLKITLISNMPFRARKQINDIINPLFPKNLCRFITPNTAENLPCPANLSSSSPNHNRQPWQNPLRSDHASLPAELENLLKLPQHNLSIHHPHRASNLESTTAPCCRHLSQYTRHSIETKYAQRYSRHRIYAFQLSTSYPCLPSLHKSAVS